MSILTEGTSRNSKTWKLWVIASCLSPTLKLRAKVQTSYFLSLFAQVETCLMLYVVVFLLYFLPLVTAVFFHLTTPGLRRPDNTIMTTTRNRNRRICHKRNAKRFWKQSEKEFPLHLILCCSSNWQPWLTAKLVSTFTRFSDISSTNNQKNY